MRVGLLVCPPLSDGCFDLCAPPSQEKLHPNKVVVLEGAHALHPAVVALVDLTVCLTGSAQPVMFRELAKAQVSLCFRLSLLRVTSSPDVFRSATGSGWRRVRRRRRRPRARHRPISWRRRRQQPRVRRWRRAGGWGWSGLRRRSSRR